MFPTVLMEDTAKSRDVLRCVLDSLQKSLGRGSPVPGCTNKSVRAERRRLRAGYGSALVTSRGEQSTAEITPIEERNSLSDVLV